MALEMSNARAPNFSAGHFYFDEGRARFTDVPSGTLFASEMNWMEASGISTGWPEADGTKTYRPYLPVALPP